MPRYKMPKGKPANPPIPAYLKQIALRNPSYMGKELPNQPPHSYNGSKNHPEIDRPTAAQEAARRRREREALEKQRGAASLPVKKTLV